MLVDYDHPALQDKPVEQKEEVAQSSNNVTAEIAHFFKFFDGDMLAKELWKDKKYTYYRVNWWNLRDLIILKSAFLRVSKTKDGLVIEDITKKSHGISRKYC